MCVFHIEINYSLITKNQSQKEQFQKPARGKNRHVTEDQKPEQLKNFMKLKTEVADAL